MVVAQTATTTLHVDQNPHQDKGHQQNHAECDKRNTHFGSRKEAKPHRKLSR
jgi:hypothetical protein